MLTTTQLRKAWSPACASASTRQTLNLNGSGRITVDRRTIPAFKALNACLVAHHYLTRRNDTGAYNCRRITGGTGYSLHAYGIAADLNWQTNPYSKRLITDMPAAMVADIKAIRTRNGRQVFGWGGDYRSNKDAMHFEIVCSPADLATGINPATVPGAKPAPVADLNAGRVWRQFGGAGATDDNIYNKATNPGQRYQVSELQMLLAHLGFYRAKVDGIYGVRTVSAVIAFKDSASWRDRSSIIDADVIGALRALAAAKK